MTEKPRGTCRFCSRDFRVRNGTVVFHRQRDVFVDDTVHAVEYQWPQPPCPGWGLPAERDS